MILKMLLPLTTEEIAFKLVMVVGVEIDVVSKKRQNCIVVMYDYDFKRNAFFQFYLADFGMLISLEHSVL